MKIESFNEDCITGMANRLEPESIDTHESLAAKMRDAGFNEDIVRNFEEDNFCDDIITEK